MINEDALPTGRPFGQPEGDIGPVQVPDHRLLRRIGRGSYGEVWLAQHSMGTFRAVKVVFRRTFQDQRPFERELLGIRRFEPVSRSHEGFVDVLHVGQNEAEGYFYYVMELADDYEGGQKVDPESYRPKTLSSQISSRGCLPYQDCLQLGLALSQALAELHRHGLVHRDVKPSNIVFVNGVPKLADIGLVAEVQEARSYVGTEGFIPPEGPGTPAADVYGLGKVLYEASTGKDRQDFPELPTLLDQNDDFANLLELNEVILQACENDPAKRYPSGWEMHANLVVLANGHSVKRLKLLEKRWNQARHATGIGALILVICLAVGYHFYREWKTATEAFQRKVGASLANGTHAMDSGDLLGALPYFAEAVQLTQGEAREERENRLRLGSTLAQAPKITQMWFNPKQIDTVRLGQGDRRLLTVEWDGRARVFDVASGEPVSPPFGQEAPMWRSDLSADGELAVTAAADGTACVWRVKDGAKLLTLPHKTAVRSACFSPDASRIITGGEDGLARVWDASTGKRLFDIKGHEGVVLFACYDRAGRRIVTTGTDGWARLWDAQDGHSLNLSFEHSTWVGYADFSPDGETLVTACFDHRVRLWDLETGQRIPPDLPHGDGVNSAVFSPDGQLILTAGLDRTAQLWDAVDHRLLNPNPFLRHGDRVTHAVFDQTGRRVVTACVDGTARLWDLTACSLTPPGTVRVYSGDRSHYLAAVTDGLQLFDNAGAAASPALSTDGTVYGSRLNGDGSRALTTSTRLISPGCTQTVAQAWHTASGERLGPQVVFTNLSGGFALSSDGAHFLAFGGKRVGIWEATTGKACPEMQFEVGPVAGATFSMDGSRALAWGDEVVRAWNVATGNDLFPALKHGFPVRHAEFSPDGTRLVTCGAEGSFDKCPAQVWDAATGKAIAPQMQQGDGIVYATFSPDGTRLLTTSEDLSAAVWDVATGRRLTPPLRHGYTVMGGGFSTDSRWVVTASGDQTARVWSAANGDPLTPPFRLLDMVSDAWFLPGNSFVVTRWGMNVCSTWPLRIEDKPVADLVAMADLLSGGGSDTGQTFLSNPARVKEAWTRLRSKYPSDFSSSPQELAQWHDLEAKFAGRRERWGAAVFHLEKLMAARPADAAVSNRLSQARLKAGRPN
jgi:WD40 repeat protein